jgi:hypothetical protein
LINILHSHKRLSIIANGRLSSSLVGSCFLFCSVN